MAVESQLQKCLKQEPDQTLNLKGVSIAEVTPGFIKAESIIKTVISTSESYPLISNQVNNLAILLLKRTRIKATTLH